MRRTDNRTPAVIKSTSTCNSKPTSVAFILLVGVARILLSKSNLIIGIDKFEYMDKERLRWAKRFNIPIADKFPAGFPLKTVAAQRVLVSLAISHPQCFERTIACYFDHFWGEYREPNKPENLLAILREVIGSEEEARGIIEHSDKEEIRNKLAENTDNAFKDGAFGLPWFTATNAEGETEGFWGVDRMGEMCDFLQLDGPNEKVWRASL